MIGHLLPSAAVADEAFGDTAGARLFASEEAVLGGADLVRYAEFSAGRACARAALAKLGVPPVPILPGPRGEPRWPDGVIGSITHCAGYRACAVAFRASVAALGIDAEPDRPLPAGVLAEVCSPAEQAWLPSRMAAAPEVHWDTLVFSAKEAAYKAWFPLSGATPGFAEVAMTEPEEGRFTLRLHAAGAALPSLEGRWLAERRLIVTVVAVPALAGARGRLYAWPAVRPR